MSAILDQIEYGFDRDSRRTWRRRALTTGQDDAYGYDGLSQVVSAARGNLNLNATAIGGVPAEDESWDYDPTGNWHGYRVEENGAVTLEQRRVQDKGNRLMQVEGSPGAVLVDRAGRMTQVPPDAAGEWNQEQRMVWDAWSRLVSVADDVHGLTGSYSYDGLNRRMTRVVDGVTWHTYYSDAWRALEERQDSQTTAARQYYWGARHRDDLVRRDRAVTSGGALTERRYVLMDYFSPAAITDESGEVTERYGFSAFGVRRIIAPDFSPRDTSECVWEFGFQGQFLDTESGFYDYGYRYYSPSLGRWLSKDPIEEDGGLNLYAFAENNGVNAVDYLGLTDSECSASCALVAGADAAAEAGAATAIAAAVRAAAAAAAAIGEPVAVAAVAAAAVVGTGIAVLGAAGAAIALTAPPPRARPVPIGRGRVKPRSIPRAIPKTKDDAEEICLAAYEHCDATRRDNPDKEYGCTKPCGDCLQECRNEGGAWPYYKCPY